MGCREVCRCSFVRCRRRRKKERRRYGVVVEKSVVDGVLRLLRLVCLLLSRVASDFKTVVIEVFNRGSVKRGYDLTQIDGEIVRTLLNTLRKHS